MNTKNGTLAVFGNKSRYLVFDEVFQHPLPDFDPFEQGERLFVIRKPNFIRRLERDIVEQFRVNSYDKLYRLAKVDPHDIPKVYYDKATGTWTSDNNMYSAWPWIDPSQRKLPLKPSPLLAEYHRVGECPSISPEEYDTLTYWMEYLSNTISRQLNKLLE